MTHKASHNYIPSDAKHSPIVQEQKITPISKPIKRNHVKYKCDGRQHCSQMHSYEEAKYFLDHCKDTKMDGDKDGIPCERQFNHY